MKQDSDPNCRLEGRDSVSELTTSRLSVYLRCLSELEAEGIETISSQDLADRIHLKSAQIRKDLAHFGDFGIRGVGYEVRSLKRRLTETLGLDQTRRVVIMGAGNLGTALAHSRGFNTSGFRVVALIDEDPNKIGTKTRAGVPIRGTSEINDLVNEHGIEIAILAVPAEAAQQASDLLIDSGIRAILNFAPVRIDRADGVKVKDVDLRVNLETLAFFLKSSEV